MIAPASWAEVGGGAAGLDRDVEEVSLEVEGVGAAVRGAVVVRGWTLDVDVRLTEEVAGAGGITARLPERGAVVSGARTARVELGAWLRLVGEPVVEAVDDVVPSDGWADAEAAA